MLDDSDPVTRLSTDDAALFWMNRVISLDPTEKPCQLMMAFGLLVILSALPAALKDAVPLITVGPTGFACAAPAKQDATASATNFVRKRGECMCNPSTIGTPGPAEFRAYTDRTIS
jgi:hypothetical protein